ncbi:hypothetical protein SAMN06295912_103127 [Sphingomonas laterariae]|uniref:Uncharacterized protein n=1 Tax=Edaphosphingomonas laterariae TaxID=861865 RepID=A0A239D0P6_9SPHN|nr:hypothetical protein [Sphingomonas laterariae]SNS25374.1 hypothetical protein SAMN06295912_103127 [Sphingomonas laterariae]
MVIRSWRLGIAALATIVGAQAAPAAASYLYWVKPNLAGDPVRGDEPGIGLAMPKATPKELQAHLLWNMRAGLNVAALQCQFSPSLMTVRNYNDILRHHDRELNDAYNTLGAYFKRMNGRGWQKDFDQYTTKTYNGFSTLHAQYSFCDTAALIGRDAVGRRKGDLHLTAETRMREFRNSLVPTGDGLYAYRYTLAPRQLADLSPKCWDKKGRYNSRKCG